MQLQRNDSGKFDSFAWPGGYPIYYLTEDNAVLCPDCANGQNGSEANEHITDDPQWHLVACDVHYDGQPLTCEHCNAQIESAYGDHAED